MATVAVTEEAAHVLREIRGERSGRLSITIEGGCCEGSAPHLYEDYLVPPGSQAIGDAEGIPVYLPPPLDRLYGDAALVIDIVDDPASDAFSIETARGLRLVLRERS